MIYFVPARKGSQRVRDKNKRMLCGKPLVDWTFDVLKAERDNVLVSSNDDEILGMADARNFATMKRPPHLCGSASRMSDVLFYCADELGEGLVCVLYPTSPLRTRSHIDNAVKMWKRMARATRTRELVVMGVERVDHRPFGLMSIVKDGHLIMNARGGNKYYRGQDMPEAYRANGAIYVMPVELIRERKIDSQLFGPVTYPFIMDKLSSVEVDDTEDFVIAEGILKQMET